MKLKSLIKRRSIEQKIYDRKYFNKIIQESKFVDLFDGSFAFEYETDNVCINFYKDENGKNIIEQFLIKSNGNWNELILMDFQEEIMFNKLDEYYDTER